MNAKGLKKTTGHSQPDPDAWQPVDFMNFIDRPKEPERTPEQNFALIDKEVFGIA